VGQFRSIAATRLICQTIRPRASASRRRLVIARSEGTWRSRAPPHPFGPGSLRFARDDGYVAAQTNHALLSSRRSRHSRALM
jgi:hypothetical protein